MYSMQLKDKWKPLFDELFDLAQKEGLDLTVDSIQRTIVYLEHPEIPLTIEIGGLFYQDLEVDLEEEEVH